MVKKKYSIIVPVYNAEKYIKRCLNSIISQSYSNIEIILINDGSTDNTANILEEYKQSDDRFVIIHLENGGVSNARNIGIRKATGDYITFIDADDYIENITIEEINRVLEKNTVDILKYNYITEIGIVKRKYQFKISKSRVITNNEFDKCVYPYVFTTNDMANVWNAFIKTSIAKSVLFDVNLKYAEDSKFMFECINLATSLFVLDKYMYHYIQNSNSAVNTINYNKKMLQLENVIKANIFIYKRINNKQFLNYFEKRIINAFLECLIYNTKIKNRRTYEKELKNIFEEENVNKIVKELSEISDIYICEYLLKMKRVVINKKIIMKIKKCLKKILIDK